MLLSSVGFAFYFIGDSPSSGPGTADANQAIGDAANSLTLNFDANVNAKINAFSNAYVLLGDTNVSNINEIDSTLLKIKGVSGVKSQFMLNQDPSIASTYRYRAELSVYDINRENIRILIDDATKGIFSYVYLYPYVRVTFDNNVHFFNTDFNIVKDYIFGNPIATIIADEFAEIGDEIVVYLQVTFMNGVPTKITGYMLSNNSQAVKNVQFIKKIIPTLDKTVVMLSGVHESDFDVNDLNAIVQLYDANLITDFDNNTVYFINTDYNIDSLISDVNHFVFDNNANLDAQISAVYVVNFLQERVLNEGKYLDYNKQVSAELEYGKYDLNKEIEFILMAYISREDVLGVNVTTSYPNLDLDQNISNQ